jgi:hypothetical protein
MRKFIVHTRPLPGCCKGSSDAPSIVEVEGKMIAGPSAFLPEGEFYFYIVEPNFLHEPREEKQGDGSKKKIMVPVTYHSHAIYHDVEEAQTAAKKMIKSGLDFEVRKGRLASYTEEELNAKYAEVQVVMLNT